MSGYQVMVRHVDNDLREHCYALDNLPVLPAVGDYLLVQRDDNTGYDLLVTERRWGIDKAQRVTVWLLGRDM